MSSGGLISGVGGGCNRGMSSGGLTGGGVGRGGGRDRDAVAAVEVAGGIVQKAVANTIAPLARHAREAPSRTGRSGRSVTHELS